MYLLDLFAVLCYNYVYEIDRLNRLKDGYRYVTTR